MKFHRGYGGFFNAISQLCPRAEENYSLAHKMGDLKMGDVHLIPVETGDNEDESKRPLYIANLICQSRVAGRISGINMEKLALGLKKIALAAHAMKGNFLRVRVWTRCSPLCTASVHLPRIGAHLPTTNYYSVERLIRTCIANKKIPTFMQDLDLDPFHDSHLIVVTTSLEARADSIDSIITTIVIMAISSTRLLRKILCTTKKSNTKTKKKTKRFR